MAKKARKKSKPARTTKTRKKTAKKTTKKKSAKKKTAKRVSKRKTIGDRLSSAYHTVIDTVKGTDQLRNKLEKPGTSESE